MSAVEVRSSVYDEDAVRVERVAGGVDVSVRVNGGDAFPFVTLDRFGVEQLRVAIVAPGMVPVDLPVAECHALVEALGESRPDLASLVLAAVMRSRRAVDALLIDAGQTVAS